MHQTYISGNNPSCTKVCQHGKKKFLLFKFYSLGSLNQCTSIFTTTRYFLLAQHESLIICLKIASCAISILQREVKSYNLPALAITCLTVKLSSKDCVTVALKCWQIFFIFFWNKQNTEDWWGKSSSLW